MLRHLLLSAFLAFFIIPISAQKAKVRLTYQPTLHNLTYSEENMHRLQLKKEPYILYLGYEATDFQDAFINWKKNTFQVKAKLCLLDINDTTHVKVLLTLTNITRESRHWRCFIDFNEHVITLKDRKGKGIIHGLPIHCSPPLTPNGKELFLDAKVRVDLRDENKCSIEYTIREEKVDKVRTDEDFKSRAWSVFKDEGGDIHRIYWDGLEVVTPVNGGN